MIKILIPLLAFAALAIYVFFVKLKAYKIPLERCICITGAMGAGKTFLGVFLCNCCKAYINTRELLKKLLHPKKHIIQWATIYSNIPLKLKCYRQLLPEHISKDKLLPENAIIFIDEIGGSLADQWSYTQTTLTIMLTEFFRYSRHWFNGFIICTDQTISCVPKPVRDRCAKQYHLSNCRNFFTYKKIDILPLMVVDDNQTQVQQKTQEQGKAFKSEYIIIPKKIFKLYESRCYRYTYEEGFVFNANDDTKEHGPLYTRLYLDVSPDPALDNLAKNNRKQLIRVIFGKKPRS